MQNTKYKKIFLCIDVLLHVIILLFVGFTIYQANKYMSFAGFGSLFMLILLIPYFVLLTSVLVFLFISIALKKRIPIIVALILQIICCLLWILTMCLFQADVSWIELVLMVQIIVAIAALLSQ